MDDIERRKIILKLMLERQSGYSLVGQGDHNLTLPINIHNYEAQLDKLLNTFNCVRIFVQFPEGGNLVPMYDKNRMRSDETSEVE